MTAWAQQPLFELDDFDNVWRPQRPLCSDTKKGPYKRRAREDALAYSFIETNPTCLQSLIVADVDVPDSFWEYERQGLPVPSWRVTNVLTDHYHAVWALRDPVCLTDAARRPPVNFLARVEAGLRRGLCADEAYGGRIMRNPLVQRNTATTFGINDEDTAERFRTYGLRELANALEETGFLPAAAEKKALLESAVGRNVQLFDLTRQWGYRAVKRYWGGSFEEWHETVLAYATTRNLGVIADQWGTPLPQNEVRHLTRSISKWIWKRFTPEKFSEIQRARGRKGGLKGGRKGGLKGGRKGGLIGGPRKGLQKRLAVMQELEGL